MSTWHDFSGTVEDYLKIVSSIIAKYLPSPYGTPIQYPNRNAEKYRIQNAASPPLQSSIPSVVFLSQDSHRNDTNGRDQQLAAHRETRGSALEGNGRGLSRGGGGAYWRDRTGSGGRYSRVARWVAVRHRDGEDRWGRCRGNCGGGGDGWSSGGA